MRPLEHLKPQGGKLNLTPMIDMVFLLIIFFLFSSNLIQQEDAVEVDLPVAETGTLPPEQQPKRLTISIPDTGKVYVGTEPLDQAALSRMLKVYRRDWGDDMEIQIRSSRTLPYGEVKPILQMAAECGIFRISFAVTRNL